MQSWRRTNIFSRFVSDSELKYYSEIESRLALAGERKQKTHVSTNYFLGLERLLFEDLLRIFSEEYLDNVEGGEGVVGNALREYFFVEEELRNLLEDG